MYRRIDPAVFDRAMVRRAAGGSVSAVAHELGISRQTIRRWERDGRPRSRPTCLETAAEISENLDEPGYSYLLGMYLGDGHIASLPRTTCLVLSLDPKYPGVIDEGAGCLLSVGRSRVSRRLSARGVAIVYSYWAGWPILFPQAGPGKKHERKIELEDWQEEITRRHTRQFVRGLIQSDGSRCINRFSVKLPSGRVGHYAYPRYFFTNYSEDIRRIFCEHCDFLGIRWTQSNTRNISVSHRDSVAILDSFIGPKR